MPIGTALAAGGSLLASMLGYQSQNLTNERNRLNVESTNKANQAIADRANYFNREIARETNETNERIAMENLGFQRDLQEYQKSLQQQQWEREDTSYQRTAQDMLAAGLNPLDMQSTNGAGEVVSISPLENTFQAQQSSPMVASRNEAFQEANAMNTALQASSAIGSIAQTFNQIETGSLQRDSLALENDRKKLENIILQMKSGVSFLGGTPSYKRHKGTTVLDSTFNNAYGSMWTDSAKSKREFEHMVEAGIYDTDTDFERILTALSDWINNGRGADELKKLQETFPILKAFNLGGN